MSETPNCKCAAPILHHLPCANQATAADGLCGACHVCWDLGGECRPPNQPSKPLEAPSNEDAIKRVTDDVLERAIDDAGGI